MSANDPHFPMTPREELEIKLTSFLLGELGPEEAEQLGEAIGRDPELAKLRERLKATIGLVGETVEPRQQKPQPELPQLKLSADRRQKLLQQFKIIRPTQLDRPRRPWHSISPVLVAAVVVLLLVVAAGLLLPALSTAKTRSMTTASLQRQALAKYWDKSGAPAANVPPAEQAQEAPNLWHEDQTREARRFGTIVLPQGSDDAQKRDFVPGQAGYGGFVAEGRGESDKSLAFGKGQAVENPRLGWAAGTTGGGMGGGGGAPVATPSPPAAGLRGGSLQAGQAISESVQPLSESVGKAVVATTDTLSVDPTTGLPMAEASKVPRLDPNSGLAPKNDGRTELRDTDGESRGRSEQVPPIEPTTGLPMAPERLAKDSIPTLGDVPMVGAAITHGGSGTEVKPAGEVSSQLLGITTTPGGQVALFNDKANRQIGAVPLDNEGELKPAEQSVERALPSKTSESASVENGDISSFRRRYGLAQDGKTKAEISVKGATPAPPASIGLPLILPPAASTPPQAPVVAGNTFQSFDSAGSERFSGGYGLNTPSESKLSLQDSKRAPSEQYAGRAVTHDFYSDADVTTRSGSEVARQKMDQLAQTERGNVVAHSFEVDALGRKLAEAGEVDRKASSARREKELVAGFRDESTGKTTSLSRRQSEIYLPQSSAGDLAWNYAWSDNGVLNGSVAAGKPKFKGLPADKKGEAKIEELASGSVRAPATVLRIRPQTADEAAKKVPPPAAPIPQPEILTRQNAFSTFSLNVSDVSFKLAGASLEKGVMPDSASIRSEEFINAFDYRDPEPAAGAPIAFAWERARYPFAQNRDLLRFSIKTAAQGRQAGRPLNLVLLLDNSGSMERADRVQIINQALRVLATQLQPQDKLSVVIFARTAHLWVDGLSGNQAAKVAEEVGRLTPQGGTNLEEAMNLAYQTALRHYLANGINRVVLLTDGAANLGEVEPESLKQKVESNRKQGIAFDCFGIGWEGYNDDLLEVLARNGDGRYGFINSPEAAATEFAGQLAGALNVAASDVKVQVEFNPGRVTAYRQIGYARHQLKKEQFRDNTVDAAEIGAAESGNALYVAEVNPRGEGPIGTVRVRYKVPGTADYREQEWAVPYAGEATPLDQASPAMRLAASASAFSEWLSASPYAGEVTTDRLLSYAAGLGDIYGADPRPKRLEWMIRQAKSISGK